MNKEERVNFYLGNLITLDKHDISLNADIKNLENDPHNMSVYPTPVVNYVDPFIKLLIKTNNDKKKFNYLIGDNHISQPPTTILKSRGRGCNGGVILRCFNFDRHWSHYYKKPKDMKFDNKINKVIWRGTTTGEPDNPASRFKLVTEYYNKYPNIDVGFSFICQGKDDFKKYVKNQLKITDMLKYKYIISVEGNDKDSGLNWKLNSNSVILMAKPRITTWLMETTLIPDVHYVLLKDDYSDLREKYIWCKNHPNECKQIIKNANMFMKQFNNKEREQEIEEAVINKYFDLTN
jgi:hypothetical protein